VKEVILSWAGGILYALRELEGLRAIQCASKRAKAEAAPVASERAATR